MDLDMNPFNSHRDAFDYLSKINHAKEQEKHRKLLEEQVRLQKESIELEKKRLEQEQKKLEQEQKKVELLKQESKGKPLSVSAKESTATKETAKAPTVPSLTPVEKAKIAFETLVRYVSSEEEIIAINEIKETVDVKVKEELALAYEKNFGEFDISELQALGLPFELHPPIRNEAHLDSLVQAILAAEYYESQESLISYYREKFGRIPSNYMSRIVFFMATSNKPKKNPTESDQLFEAIENQDFERVKKLLAEGVNVNSKNEAGETPLQVAVEAYSYDDEISQRIVQILVKNGADTSDVFPDKTMIHWAIEEDRDLLEYLLKDGDSINVKNKQGDTPICFALNELSDDGICKEDIELIDRFIKCGADVNVTDHEGYAPLHSAVIMANRREEGWMDLVKFLVEQGADVNARSENGTTPLHETNELEISEYLIEHGANINVSDNAGLTPLHNAIYSEYHDEDNIELVKVFVERGADVSLTGPDGKTPLDWAYTWKDSMDNFEGIVDCLQKHLS